MEFFRHPLAKDALITLLLGVGAFAALGATGWLALVGSGELGPDAVAYEEDPLRERELIDFRKVDTQGGRQIIVYQYLGEPLPQKLSPREVVSLRTDSSYTSLERIENEGTPQEQRVHTIVSYPRQSFTKRDGVWRYVERGETSLRNLDQKLQEARRLPRLLLTAHADTFFPGSIDGVAMQSATPTSTNASAYYTVQAALLGSGTSTTFNIDYASSEIYTFKSTTVIIRRGFMPFVTSTIPANATITAATLNLYGTTTSPGLVGPDNDGNDFITIVQSTQARYDELLYTDYDQCGSPLSNPTEGIDVGQRKDISSGGFATSSAGASALNSFTLNATGRGWIKKAGQSSSCGPVAGTTCFCIREGHDALRDVPANETQTFVEYVSSDNSGTNNDPYLSVTYTVPGGAFWTFQDY